ncbi:hypothetical protein AKJ09_01146 [Labilithrix luteola]|uniref:Peptidase S54 rhomboid domain-containing protein n=1 Tax=Labilithrix luteola TaxID=1391654 RepID=A0A0K1PLT4_9BACT|nr:rhomboid family intramembrane serine protease [Labilithrix luteola]AKU94482.1 hypothetical protein AKJ09_01146 [Labilithrix luteola]
MDRILARLERGFLGKLAIERLTTFIVGGMAIAFVLIQVRPELYGALELDPALVAKQPWRVVSYLFLPQSLSLFWVFFVLYFFWIMGTALEQEWGAFKFNVYYLIGALGTTAAALITREPQGNFWLNTSVYFAFATLYPDYVITLFFILPVRIKWLALLLGAYIGWNVVIGDIGTKAAILAAFANYFVFFGGHLMALLRGRRLVMKQSMRRASIRSAGPVVTEGRSCAICGARQDDGADIRVCSCEKCGGKPRDLCLEHARNH